MNSFIPRLSYDAHKPLYIQIYEHMKTEIVSGRLPAGEKLPSLRNMAASLKLSVTTVELAYSQLAVEGYIYSREKSGYYVGNAGDILNLPPVYKAPQLRPQAQKDHRPIENTYADTALFDFVKWKKCLNQVINEFPLQLAREASPEGEEALREQIALHLYMTRGVLCSAQQIVIAAGTQQLLNIIAGFFRQKQIHRIACEDPGYLLRADAFRQQGFQLLPTPLDREGISLSHIQKHRPGAICVSPSNQFPSGIVMPAGKRYALLRYAHENDCIILEDDYASELRYFGRPVPPVKSLDPDAPVLYLGSFSSVLFPSSKISYMVLPQQLMAQRRQILSRYNQTCSKTEQLALALYMEKGLFQTHVKKLRKLYSQKISLAVESLKKAFGKSIRITGRDSGLNMLLEVHLDQSADQLCQKAEEAGLRMVPYKSFCFPGHPAREAEQNTLIFYYHWIPLEQIPQAVNQLAGKWLEGKGLPARPASQGGKTP